jgi:hypothetical protein
MLAPQHPARLRLSAKVRRLYRQGKISEALGAHYEDRSETKLLARVAMYKVVK